MSPTWARLEVAAQELADRWRTERADRTTRTHLVQADFDALRNAEFWKVAAPAAVGGLWESSQSSLRPLCGVLRTLARGDGAVALVAAMHPAVLVYWLANPDASQPKWERQREAVFASAMAGTQWGTITSEPGSGGDISRTRAVAEVDPDRESFLDGDCYRISGDKHFGSGAGMSSYMITTALRADADEPDLYVLDMEPRPWDGTTGLELLAEWDGMGMAATQSHAMRLTGAHAVRAAWGGSIQELMLGAAPVNLSLFTAVVLGILDEAVGAARARVVSRADYLRPYEQVEWVRADTEHWLATQAFEGMLRAVESGDQTAAIRETLQGKSAVGELAEQVMLRLTRVLGGGTFSRRSPFSHWFEDVRALGFLRPPWGLAYDIMYGQSLD